MTFGPIVVSMTGIALPILAGLWLMPKGDRRAAVDLSRSAAGAWLLLRRIRAHLGALSTAVRQRHLSGGVAPGSTVRYG